MPYSRRILHYAPGPTDLVGVISDRVTAGAWFELHRLGGCGAGELRLRDEFPDRGTIEVGHWIAFEYEEDERWYLGRVTCRQAVSPAGVVLRLEGMGGELDEVWPGGFSSLAADGAPPHRYADADLFPDDPDYGDEAVDAVSEPHELVELLVQQYVVPRTHIAYDPNLIESSPEPALVSSVKFRGEEPVRAAVQELAFRARNAAWGVDEQGTFFFLRRKQDLLAAWREGTDLVRLEESRDRELLFNRVLLTGDYIYDEPPASGVLAGFYRWRGHYIQPDSRDQYGERRIRIQVPWLRTPDDSLEFTREFFRVYAEPAARYTVEVAAASVLPRPWEGQVRIEDRDGGPLVTAPVETVRVQFDHAPRLLMTIGPPDPRRLWPAPPHDERWPIPGTADVDFGGELVAL